MTPTLIFILLFSILPTSTPLKIPENDEVTISPAVNDEVNISPTVSYESSLSFEWTGPMSMRLRNRDGNEDDIELRPSKGIGNVQVDCLFVGYLTKDTGGSAGVVGCQQSSLVSITIISNYSSGTMFNLFNRNETTVELLYTSVINNYEEEELGRDKRSSYYEDDVIYDYIMDDYSFDGAESIPPNVYYEFALSYDQAFLTKMNENTTAAEEYIAKVANQAQVYFKDPSLGVIIHFVINKNIRYLEGKHFTINPRDPAVKSNIKDAHTIETIRDARKIETSEPLVIFTKTDDLETWRGIATNRKACNPSRGRAIIKHRDEFQRAALTMAHELGHWFGNLHDGEQDEKNNKDKPKIDHTYCEGRGIMTDSVTRPKQWSDCSRQRLAKFFHGHACLKPAPACNNDNWVQDVPCSCGDGPKTNLCSTQNKGYCILETGTCIDGELVEDIDHQIPEFLFNCLTNMDPWIFPCVPFRRYLMIFDSQGNFFQEMTNQNDNSKYLRTSVIKKVQKPKAKDIQDGKGHPNYLLQLERTDQQTGSFFIATKSGQLLVAGSEIMPSLHLRKDHCSQGKDMQVTESPLDMSITSTESPTTPHIVSTPAPDMDYACDQAYWRLWKVDGRYLLIESVTKPGFFLNVESGSHKVRLGKQEKMTGIYTSFLSHMTLERTVGQVHPEIEDEAYGDVVVHYVGRDGSQHSGYVCDYDWGLESAVSVCNYFGFQTGLPTYDGLHSSTNTPEYVVSGLKCENEDIGQCKSRTICGHDYHGCLSQMSMKAFDGNGYGCNRGSATDIPGVVCGNQMQIFNLLKQEETCDRASGDNDRKSVVSMFSIQKHIIMIKWIFSEDIHWSEYFLKMPMSVSVISTLFLASSQNDGEIYLTKPPQGRWNHLKYDYLQPNLLFLAHKINETFLLSSANMRIIKANTETIHGNMMQAVHNAFSSKKHDLKTLLPANLRYIAEVAKTNKEKVEQVHTAFKNIIQFLDELLFGELLSLRKVIELESQKCPKEQIDALVESSRYLYLPLQQWDEVNTFFKKLSNFLEIMQSRIKRKSQFFWDIEVNLPRSELNRMRSFKEDFIMSVVDVLALNIYIGRVANLYTIITDDYLIQRMTTIGKYLEKFEDPVEFQKMKKSIEDEDIMIQEKIKLEVSKVEAEMSDEIMKGMSGIKNELTCKLKDAESSPNEIEEIAFIPPEIENPLASNDINDEVFELELAFIPQEIENPLELGFEEDPFELGFEEDPLELGFEDEDDYWDL